MRKRKGRGQITGLLSPYLEGVRLRQALPHVPDGSTILDIGCGRASLLGHLQPTRYVGVDVIPEVIHKNQSRYPGYEFHMLNVEKLDMVGLGEFDVVLMLAVIEHFEKAEEVLKKVNELLAPKGRIILTTPHPRGEWVMSVGSRLGLLSRESRGEHRMLLGIENIRQMCKRSGLRLSFHRTFLLGMNQLAVLAR